MIRKTLIAAALLAATSGVALAQSAAATGQFHQHARLDANGDGVIDRSEAAKMPWLAQHFDQLDKNKDGKLSQDERPQRQWGRHGMHGGGAGGITAMDTDGDGRISKVEAKGFIADKFADIDANHDGYIVRSEMQAFGERMRPQMQAKFQQHAAQRFAAADTNHDGKLSRSEVEQNMPRLAKQFAWLDDNRDGYLSQSELQAGHGGGFGGPRGR